MTHSHSHQPLHSQVTNSIKQSNCKKQTQNSKLYIKTMQTLFFFFFACANTITIRQMLTSIAWCLLRLYKSEFHLIKKLNKQGCVNGYCEVPVKALTTTFTFFLVQFFVFFCSFMSYFSVQGQLCSTKYAIMYLSQAKSCSFLKETNLSQR